MKDSTTTASTTAHPPPPLPPGAQVGVAGNPLMPSAGAAQGPVSSSHATLYLVGGLAVVIALALIIYFVAHKKGAR